MLRIENVTKSFGDRTVLDRVTYHFPVGERLALVGANGAGKTTLLNILCGLAPADSGSVLRPGTLRVGYLPQHPNPAPAATILVECLAGNHGLMTLHAEMQAHLDASAEDSDRLTRYEACEAAYRQAGGYSAEADAAKILSGLGFQPHQIHAEPRSLSGGWRMRLELARLLVSRPDFLILDEPTNHLDLPSLIWMERFLAAFRGTLVFVSHDRTLLDHLATRTLHLSGGQLTEYKGNFSRFLEQREQQLEQRAAEISQVQRRRREIEQFVNRFGASATKAAQAQSRLKMLARLTELESSLVSPAADTMGASFKLPQPGSLPGVILNLEDGAIGYPGKTLVRGLNLQLLPGQRVAVIGANGLGKSTLLRSLNGELPLLGGSVSTHPAAGLAYCAQSHTAQLETGLTVLETLMQASTLSPGECRGVLGALLFSGDDVTKMTGVLSGGERARLALACAFVKRPGLLLLDEPTNHLDMSSAEALAGALSEFAGSLVFVSHDRAFIDSVATHLLILTADGRVTLVHGNLAENAALEQLLCAPDTPQQEPKSASASTPSSSYEDAKEIKRRRQRLESQIARLDTQIRDTQLRVHRLEQELVLVSSSDYQRATTLSVEVEQLKSELARWEDEWLSQATALEDISRS